MPRPPSRLLSLSEDLANLGKRVYSSDSSAGVTSAFQAVMWVLLSVSFCLGFSLGARVLFGWRREWHPTPVLLPGNSHGQRSLVGCRLWGRTGSDTTEGTWQQQQQQCSSERPFLEVFRGAVQRRSNSNGFQVAASEAKPTPEPSLSTFLQILALTEFEIANWIRFQENCRTAELRRCHRLTMLSH